MIVTNNNKINNYSKTSNSIIKHNNNNNVNINNNNNNNNEKPKSVYEGGNKESKNCNCRKSNKHNCPLQGNCLIKNVVYKVRVKCDFTDNNNISNKTMNTSNNNNYDERIYIGSTGGYFKDRYTGHKHTFNNINKKHSTRLSDFVWQYFDRYGTKPEMEWSILYHANSNINGASKICQICNIERMAIAAEDNKKLLNKRRDISNNCAHNRRFFFK